MKRMVLAMGIVAVALEGVADSQEANSRYYGAEEALGKPLGEMVGGVHARCEIAAMFFARSTSSRILRRFAAGRWTYRNMFTGKVIGANWLKLADFVRPFVGLKLI